MVSSVRSTGLWMPKTCSPATPAWRFSVQADCAAVTIRAASKNRRQIRGRRGFFLEAKPAFDMEEVLTRNVDRARDIARAQRRQDRAMLVDGADRLRGRFVDRDHDRRAAEQVAQEARQV